MALTTWAAFESAHPEKANLVSQNLLVLKGVGQNEMYVLEVDPATGQLPVTFSNVVDFGATTTAVRVAAIIGNTTGQADFWSGATTAQTLRVAVATDSAVLLNARYEAMGTPLSTRLGDGTAFLPYLSIAAAQKTQGAITGSVLPTTSFMMGWDGTGHREVLVDSSGNIQAVLPYTKGAGTVDANTLRTTPASDSPHLLAMRHETVTTPLATRISDGTSFIPSGFGAVANGLRAVAIPGNVSGIADFGSGVQGAQTPRITPATDAPHLLNTRHEDSRYPLSLRVSDGTNFLNTPAIAAAQASLGSMGNCGQVVALSIGWDGSNHRELLLDSGGRNLLSTRHEAVATPLSARLGNGTSFADFGSGAAGANTLRVSVATDSTAAATPLATRQSNGTNFVDFGVGQAGAATPRVITGGRVASNAFVRNDYASTAVSTSAYVQLVASTSAATTRLQIFDSGGQTMKLATGAPGSESDQFVIPPGGIDIDYYIPASARVSIKAVSASANTGECDINFLT